MEHISQIFSLQKQYPVFLLLAFTFDIITLFEERFKLLGIISLLIIFLTLGFYLKKIFRKQSTFPEGLIDSILIPLEVLIFFSLFIAILFDFTKPLMMIFLYLATLLIWWIYRVTMNEIEQKKDIDIPIDPQILLPLVLPILLSVIISIVFVNGINIYDPFYFVTNLRIFGQLGNIDWTMLSYSQSEGFYSFFLFINIYLGLDSLIWLRISPVVFMTISSLLIFGITLQFTDNHKFLWFTQFFIFFIGFPFVSNIAQFWPSGLANIFFLYIFYLLISSQKSKEGSILLFMTSVACIVTHIFIGLVVAFLLQIVILFHNQPIRDRKIEFFLSEISVIAILLRSIFSTNIWSYYTQFLNKYILRIEFIVIFFIFSIIIRKFGQIELREEIWDHIIFQNTFQKRFLYKLLPIIIIFVTLIVTASPSLIYYLEEVITSGASYLTLSPVIAKIPLLFFLFFIFLLGFYYNILHLQYKNEKKTSTLFIYFFGLLSVFIASYILNWLDILKFFYGIRVAALLTPFLAISLYKIFLHAKNGNLFIVPAIILTSIILIPSAFSIILPNSNLLIKDSDYNSAELILSNLEAEDIIITNDIRIYVLLYYYNNGTRSDYPTYNLSPAINYTKVIFRDANLYLFKINILEDIIENQSFDLPIFNNFYFNIDKIHFIFRDSYIEGNSFASYLQLEAIFSNWYLFKYID